MTKLSDSTEAFSEKPSGKTRMGGFLSIEFNEGVSFEERQEVISGMFKDYEKSIRGMNYWEAKDHETFIKLHRKIKEVLV